MFFFLKQLTSWDRWNQFLVSLSILAFLPLQFPQVISNAAVIGTGNPAAIATLGVIPVGGYAAGILGNLLLMNFLAGQREFWGTTVQAAGIVTADIVIFQLFQVGFIPGWLFWPATLFLVVGMVLNYGHFFICDRPGWQDQFWPQWRRILQWLGIALLPALVVLQLHDAFFAEFPRMARGPWGGVSLEWLDGATDPATNRKLTQFFSIPKPLATGGNGPEHLVEKLAAAGLARFSGLDGKPPVYV